MAEVKAPALSPALVKQSEFVRNVWSVTVPPGIALASTMDAGFWVHCAGSLKPYDKIELRAQDNAWYAELMVRRVEKQAVHMWALHYNDLRAQSAIATPAEPVAGDYAVTYGGPSHMWRIVRQSDKAVIHKGEASQTDAEVWLTDFLAGKVTA